MNGYLIFFAGVFMRVMLLSFALSVISFIGGGKR